MMSGPDTTIVRRVHRNNDGSWDKTEKHIKEALTYAKVVEDLANDLVKADAKLRNILLEAYKEAPMTDALFYDSPISPDKQTLNLKIHFKKLSWPGIRDVIIDVTRAQNFSDTIKDGCKWLLKFKK